MKIRQVISVHPHRVLRQKAVDVFVFDELLKHKVNRMLVVMRGFNGVGIAANQCFLSDNIFVAKIENEEKVFINPKLTDVKTEPLRSEEGCLSIPGVVDTVLRFSEVTVQYQDIDGASHTETFTREAAVIVQHEMDHLNGRLFTDKLSSVKKGIITRKMNKFKKSKGLI